MLQITQLPNSKTILIPVADENLNIRAVTDIDIIKCGERQFKVFDFFVYTKGEHPQRALMKLALGVDIPDAKIWEKYNKSQHIYLFVCDELEIQYPSLKEE